MIVSRLKELIVLADQLNFSKAASRLYITQSALSKHVAAVEREAGFAVFKRSTSKVELTDAGKVFIDGLRRIVQDYETILSKAHDISDAGETVRVLGPFSNEHILSLMTAARSRLEVDSLEPRISCSDIGLRYCLDSVVEGRADIALTFLFGDLDPRLHSEHLFDIPFGIACSRDHELASVEKLTFASLGNVDRIITYPLDNRTEYHAFVIKVCREHGIDAIFEHIEEGTICAPPIGEEIVFGVYFPAYTRFGEEVVSRPLDDRSDVFSLHAIIREDENSITVRQLFDALVEEARLTKRL